MPSSLIFTGLVVLWLLILVPAVARHQQEVAHVSGASLAGRVLARPRRRGEGHPSEEGYSVDDEGARTAGTRSPEVWIPAARRGGRRTDTAVAVPPQTRREESEADDDPDGRPELDADLDTDADSDLEPAADELSDDLGDDELSDELADDELSDDADDRRWERPPPRFRPGRGGFDPDADAETARRRYAFRQRVVLTLLVAALLTAVVAAVAVRVVWWAHGGVDLLLVGYLIHLRRQVREEAAIRERRAARMAGTRRTSAADDSDLDDWARRGREVTRRASELGEPVAEEAGSTPEHGRSAPGELVDELDEGLDEDGDAARVRGVGEPVGLLPARRRGLDDGIAEPESALPRLQPAPPPPLPPGTSLVVVDDDELDLHDLGASAQPPHRRAVGQ
ncbi:MAG: hypothetical protein QOK35_422 [Pseudonocardiales bacterium]|nr:hypothetical protein [Pseudonocardiales bacterium]